jgi:uncharacterized protein (TIGR04255 family)
VSKAALGRLEKAPLAYVLAQVRLLPVLDMATYIPALHSALRSIYPRYKAIPATVIQFGFSIGGEMPLGPIDRWEFASADNKKGIVLGQSSLVFHVTEYSTYTEFQRDFENVMRIVAEHVPSMYVDRVGIRYIDYIIPGDGLTPDDYIIDGIRCAPNLAIATAPVFGFATTQFNMQEGSMVIRYYRKSGNPDLPPDMIELVIAPSEIMTIEVDEAIETAVLDTDRFMEVSFAFNVDTLLGLFMRMHDDLSNLFKEIVTELAVEKWSGK